MACRRANARRSFPLHESFRGNLLYLRQVCTFPEYCHGRAMKGGSVDVRAMGGAGYGEVMDRLSRLDSPSWVAAQTGSLARENEEGLVGRNGNGLTRTGDAQLGGGPWLAEEETDRR
jgi:hypothetical protein